MATYAPPKRGVAFVTYVALVDQSNPLVFKAAPTIASGDWKISKDGGALANLTTLPVVEPSGSAMVKISLSATEMAADNVTVVGVDASGNEWASVVINIATVANQFDDIAATVAPIRTGTLAGGNTAGVALDSGASALDGFYNGTWIQIVSGTGAGQVREIFSYTGSTRVAVAAKAFVTAPSSDSVYKILPASFVEGAMVLAANSVNASALATDAVTEIQSGLATAAALTTVEGKIDTVDSNVDTLVSSVTTDAAIASAVWNKSRSDHATAGTFGESFSTMVSGTAVSGTLSTTAMTTDLTEASDDHYNGRLLIWTSGNLLRQATAITDYDGTTKMLTFTAATEAPSAGDTFIII